MCTFYLLKGIVYYSNSKVLTETLLQISSLLVVDVPSVHFTTIFLSVRFYKITCGFLDAFSGSKTSLEGFWLGFLEGF
jgi:hypothetical protein